MMLKKKMKKKKKLKENKKCVKGRLKFVIIVFNNIKLKVCVKWIIMAFLNSFQCLCWCIKIEMMKSCLSI